MPEWTRNFPWRQGNLLTDEAIRTLDLFHPKFLDNTVVVVASHDCDLAQHPDKEPFVEVLIGCSIQKLDGNNTHAKSSRTLHISFDGSDTLLAEFVITDKHSVEKRILTGYLPDRKHTLSKESLATLQQWLAARYRRSAFPDEFERRMKELRIAEKISNVAKKHGEILTAIFFDVEEVIDEGSSEEKIYVLDIILLHETEPDFNSAEDAAHQAKEKIEQIFRSKCFDPKSDSWLGIELRYVDVVSEEALTYRQSKLLRKWRLDHISLGADPQQSLLME